MLGHAERGTMQIQLAANGPPCAADVWHRQRAVQAGTAGRDPAVRERLWAEQARLGGVVFRVADRERDELERRIERLDRRARKLGCEPIGLLDTGERDSTGAFVVLCGKAPRLASWTPAAIVSHRLGTTIVRPVGAAGGGLDPARFADPGCEHCGLRRRRAETFIVIHQQTREARQVGSGCVRDFVGGHDPQRACRQAEYLALAHAALRRRRPAQSPHGRDGQRAHHRGISPRPAPRDLVASRSTRSRCTRRERSARTAGCHANMRGAPTGRPAPTGRCDSCTSSPTPHAGLTGPWRSPPRGGASPVAHQAIAHHV
jgi:hypothetical protein